MLTIGWPQQVCAAGNSTSTPSRHSRGTTALPVSGNRASLMQRDHQADPVIGASEMKLLWTLRPWSDQDGGPPGPPQPSTN